MLRRKRCPKCKLEKSTDKFYRDRSRKDGLSVYCKTCRSEDCRKLRQLPKYNHYMANYMQNLHKKLRMQSLQKISGSKIPYCNNCGCIFLPLLQINHKNGGGRKEKKLYNNTREFYKQIVMGKRKIHDLEVLCAVCNTKHYAETKFGVRYNVTCVSKGRL